MGDIRFSDMSGEDQQREVARKDADKRRQRRYKESLYNMDLHATVRIKNVRIMRVVSGWIYTIGSDGPSPASVFVPLGVK